jgi:hypothetical protein
VVSELDKHTTGSVRGTYTYNIASNSDSKLVGLEFHPQPSSCKAPVGLRRQRKANKKDQKQAELTWKYTRLSLLGKLKH